MSDLWVAVTAEYQGHTFSHRSSYLNTVPAGNVVHVFNLELDNAADIVRRGMTAWVPQQWEVKPNKLLSDYEKIAAILSVMRDASLGHEGALAAIEEILDA